MLPKFVDLVNTLLSTGQFPDYIHLCGQRDPQELESGVQLVLLIQVVRTSGGSQTS